MLLPLFFFILGQFITYVTEVKIYGSLLIYTSSIVVLLMYTLGIVVLHTCFIYLPLFPLLFTSAVVYVHALFIY